MLLSRKQLLIWRLLAMTNLEQQVSFLYQTAIGPVAIVARNSGLTHLCVGPEHKKLLKRYQRLKNLRTSSLPLSISSAAKHITETVEYLDNYFESRFDNLSNLTLDPDGTQFQKKSWKALRQIPAGKTMSYGEIARKIKHPKASRAVGLACNRNPLLIVTPCHRVIGANKNLTGFRVGTECKSMLLDHEGFSDYRK